MTCARVVFLLVAIWFMVGWWLQVGQSSAAPKKTQKPRPSHEQTTPNLDDATFEKIDREQTQIQDALSTARARISLMMQKVYDARLTVSYRGEMEKPFKLAWIDLFIDGLSVYHKDFEATPEKQTLKIFDSYLTPGRHVVRIAVHARGPDDPPGTTPGFYAGCGMSVHIRKKSTTETLFVAEHEGDNPGREVSNQKEPDGAWDVEITSSFETRQH